MALYVLIFSKNRACQLDGLLRSIRDKVNGPFEKIYILYKATEESFSSGYEKLKGKCIFDNIEWIEEKAFRSDVLQVIQGVPKKAFLMFLVDDNVFHRQFNAEQILPFFGKRYLFVSLRCSRQYKEDIQPKFLQSEKYLAWRWTFHSKPRGKWNYPFSVDGNIFKADFIGKLINSLDFKAPNSLEGAMHSARWKLGVRWRSKALAPLEAVVFNNPLNKVQTEGETKHLDITSEQLNAKYLQGHCIDNRVLYSADPNSAHFAVNCSFVKEGPCR